MEHPRKSKKEEKGRLETPFDTWVTSKKKPSERSGQKEKEKERGKMCGSSGSLERGMMVPRSLSLRRESNGNEENCERGKMANRKKRESQ